MTPEISDPDRIAIEVHRIGWRLYIYRFRFRDHIWVGYATRREVRRVLAEFVAEINNAS